MNMARPARSVGIWDLDEEAGRYRRRSGHWPRWAESQGFFLHKDGPRVLMFGESVARALFYDPVHTLADLVGRGLRAPAELVDLARTGGRFDQIQELAGQARSLGPDAVVLFAGNNWKYELARQEHGAHARAEVDALARGGIAGLLRAREHALAEVARRTVREFCSAFDPETRIIVVIPESNLLDWHMRPLVPVLDGSAQLRWLELERELAAHLDAAAWQAVLATADEIEALDEGVSDGAHRARGRALLELGSPDAALRSFRRARDVRLWSSTVDPSWLPTVGVDAAREAALEAGADLVDLTEILPGHCSRGVPGDEFFADFCHLNSRGLALVAREIAVQVDIALDRADGATEGEQALSTWQPSASVEGGAQFCAALIGADFAQPLERIRAHVRAAKQIPEVARAMRAYSQAPARCVPWWMRAEPLSTLPTIRRFVDDVGWAEGSRHNQRLLEAFSWELTDSPALAGPGRALPEGVRSSLLDPIFAPAWRPEGWEGLLEDTDATRHYFRAHGRVSEFDFELANAEKLEIEITARLGPGGAASASIALNDEKPIAYFTVGERWQAHLVAGVGRPGHNRIRIEWDRKRFENQPYVAAAHRLEQGLPPELHLVFGEIHSLHVTPARTRVPAREKRPW
ncbi:hypothetical protein [Streptomyces sp. BE230]|uniref:hypothetical protein n=1 Tax=Streptomyces sp. BE230 TaxID=3002526 RepID=UPI002ED5061F|nr:hypothetical protein [Streptomyces sp. BE230]